MLAILPCLTLVSIPHSLHVQVVTTAQMKNVMESHTVEAKFGTPLSRNPACLLDPKPAQLR